MNFDEFYLGEIAILEFVGHVSIFPLNILCKILIKMIEKFDSLRKVPSILISYHRNGFKSDYLKLSKILCLQR